MKIKLINNFFVLLLLPIFVYGQGLKDLIIEAQGVVNNLLIPIAFGLCLFYFGWGMAKYIKSAGGEKEEGKQIMIWGVVAIFVVASIWGIISFIRSELGIIDIQKAEIQNIRN